LKVSKEITTLPFNVAPTNLSYYSLGKLPKLTFGQVKNYACMKLDLLLWTNPGWSDKVFEIYKGRLMRYEDNPLLKRMRKYG
jgi:hypothetical protein